MTRLSLILSIATLSFGAAACGGYEANNAAYDENAAYDADNAAYDAGNAAYNATDNAAYDAGNAAYPPPPVDGNVGANDMLGATPPADPAPPGNNY
jgi:hypothetical protein